MPARVPDSERAEIAELLNGGMTPYAAAKKSGRSRPTVCIIAREYGIDLNVRTTKRATQARRDYVLVERLELLNEVFDKGREMLATVEDAREFQALVIAIATAIDKRRLEDGEATNRSETVDPELRRKMKESLDELAARRRKRMAG